jgi:ABC-type sugar transport system ATPase subunit
MTAAETALAARGITRRFGPVTALAGVDLTLRPGRIAGLIGVNGAGKSTLMNILDGVLAPDAGTLTVRGREVRFAGPRAALAAGIGFIHQHTTTFPDLSVAENILIDQPRAGFFSAKAAAATARRLLSRLGLADLDPRSRTGDLPTGVRQLIDIARVLASDPAVILFDEPTSSLSRTEAGRLFHVIRDLRAEGRAVVFTSHFLDDVLDLADDIVVLRDGQVALAADRAGLVRADLVRAMLARELAEAEAALPTTPGPAILRASGLVPRRTGRPVDLTLHAGEVLGLWGLLGAGRTEVLRALTGLDPVAGGTLALAGSDGTLRPARPAEVLAEAGFVTESRHHDGLFLDWPIWKNVTSASLPRFARPGGAMDEAAERAEAMRQTAALSVRMGGITDPVASLSGGNQQKVVLARWLTKAPRLFLLDEPTHGVDVGAKAQIHAAIRALAGGGAAVLLVTSELEEMLALAHRVLVLRDGQIVAEHQAGGYDAARLLAES